MKKVKNENLGKHKKMILLKHCLNLIRLILPSNYVCNGRIHKNEHDFHQGNSFNINLITQG